jgi:hypothetical protein
LVLVALVAALTAPVTTLAAASQSEMSAALEGKPIKLSDVSQYHCHDLDYPLIHCFRSESSRDDTTAARLAASGIPYVIVWENGTYSGNSLILSQDYTALVVLAWNDRISSFKVQNSQSGRFWTDWFYGGTFYAFCCNQTVPYLGPFNDTFSSVYRI